MTIFHFGKRASSSNKTKQHAIYKVHNTLRTRVIEYIQFTVVSVPSVTIGVTLFKALFK